VHPPIMGIRGSEKLVYKKKKSKQNTYGRRKRHGRLCWGGAVDRISLNERARQVAVSLTKINIEPISPFGEERMVRSVAFSYYSPFRDRGRSRMLAYDEQGKTKYAASRRDETCAEGSIGEGCKPVPGAV